VKALRLLVLAPLLVASIVPTAALAADEIFYPVRWNGYRIYLSKPTHDNAGSRGECRGRNENVMGEYNARDAAVGFADSSSAMDLVERGYEVRLGATTYQEAVNNSNLWSATAHVPVHSNATTTYDCTSTSGTSKGMWAIHTTDYNSSQNLGEWLKYWMEPVTPGTGDRLCLNGTSCVDGRNLHELTATTAYRKAYVEAEFHTWNTGSDFLMNDLTWQWRISAGIDSHLGNPR
jgi:hypothetical protein